MTKRTAKNPVTPRPYSQSGRKGVSMAVDRGTKTSNFGVSRRENHDASGFYARFTAPVLSNSEDVHSWADGPDGVLDRVFVGTSADMSMIPDNSVALVVTSPPYFAGKAYEEALGEGHIPSTYLEYLEMLHSVFRECVRVLEPGGRIAVNVANLGRRPYRSLAADITVLLQDELQLLLRGEVIWVKQRGSSGSCAWGSFQRPTNPVLRDLTERVIIASKGRFDRALSGVDRFERGLPSEATLSRDEFMEATTDVWEIPPESATRVGHPAPFPLQLPERLIHLYTFKGDVVLDPFMGSGTTAVAAALAGRHYIGFDTDAGYAAAAEARVEKETKRHDRKRLPQRQTFSLPAVPAKASPEEDPQARAVREGRAAKDIARAVLVNCGFDRIEENVKLPGGIEINFRAFDADGVPWLFDVSGGFTSNRPGLKRTDTLWKALGKAAVLRQLRSGVGDRLVLLTTDRPPRGSAGGQALQLCEGDDRPLFAVLEMLNAEDQARLTELAGGSRA